jgi:serine/threonine-protein kinase RsbW
MTMSKTDIYSTEASLEALSGIRTYVREQLTALGIDSHDAHMLSLAVDEACSNIILHGNVKRETRIKIGINFSHQLCRITIQDNAQSFDPNSAESPDMITYFKKASHGGLGIELMRRIVDEMIYHKAVTTNDWNTLLLNKNLHSICN